MTLVLYALNRRFYLNEKGAFLESQRFAIKPANLHGAIASTLADLGARPGELSTSVMQMQRLAAELRELASKEVSF